MTMETATLARLYTSLAYAYDMHCPDKSGHGPSSGDNPTRK